MRFGFRIAGFVLIIAALFSGAVSTRLYKPVSPPNLAEQVKLLQSRPHFVLIAEEYGNPYWELVYQGALAEAQRQGITLEFTGPERAGIQEHLRVLDRAIASGVDGILTQGLSEAEFKPLIDKAVSHGIPVITVDTDAPGSQRFCYVGTDNYASGLVAGHEVIRATLGHARVGIITGSFQSANEVQRVEGFRDAVRAAPGVQVVAVESSDISRLIAAEKAGQILTQHPEVTVLFGTSSLDAMAAAQVVLERGLRGKILIVGYDDLPQTLDYIRQGVIYGSVVQNPREMGRVGVSMLVAYRAGKPVPPVVDTGVQFVTAQTLKQRGLAVAGEGD
ncbi:MAG: sugar-binding protein [Symbiobacteriia bacterium]